MAFGRLGLIMLQGHARIDGKAVELCQLVKAADDVIFDGLGEGYIMRRKDQFHGDTMQCGYEKIQ